MLLKENKQLFSRDIDINEKLKIRIYRFLFSLHYAGHRDMYNAVEFVRDGFPMLTLAQAQDIIVDWLLNYDEYFKRYWGKKRALIF